MSNPSVVTIGCFLTLPPARMLGGRYAALERRGEASTRACDGVPESFAVSGPSRLSVSSAAGFALALLVSAGGVVGGGGEAMSVGLGDGVAAP